MSIINELKIVLENGTKDKKLELLSYLNDVFESYNKNIDDFNKIMDMLIKYAIKEKDGEVTIEILNTIAFAETYQDVKEINFDIFAENITGVSGDTLMRYIDILSYTDNPKYIPYILNFRDSSDENVRSSVEEALVELRYED